jgi:hypothetical protein
MGLCANTFTTPISVGGKGTRDVVPLLASFTEGAHCFLGFPWEAFSCKVQVTEVKTGGTIAFIT